MYTIDVYNEETLISTITVDGVSVSVVNFSDIILLRPFGVRDEVSYKDLESFYLDRCFPQDRPNCKEILKNFGLDYYDPELICRKTHGQQFDDFMWLQFSDEPKVSYSDIRLR